MKTTTKLLIGAVAFTTLAFFYYRYKVNIRNKRLKSKVEKNESTQSQSNEINPKKVDAMEKMISEISVKQKIANEFRNR